MALFIVYRSTQAADTKKPASFEWHVGGKLPKGFRQVIEQVLEVQADGDELEHLFTMFVNLPYYRGPVVSWYGDLAKMIVKSLPVEY